MAQPTASSNPPPTEHASFGKVAIKLGFITEGQLEEAMKVQATAAKAGLRKRLGEILIKKGYLTPEQFQQVLKSQTVKEKKRIGDYELISKLGEGGMGSVFKARQVFMDRVIALKILSPKMAKNKDFRERFVREARAVAKLNHPHIVAGIDVGSKDGYCYFAMEFVDGESLGQYMQRKGGKLEEGTALEFIRQTALALHHAHQNNLLHRDVKPDNLLLDKERNIIKLADLGLARSAESAEDDAALTQAGQAVGTPFYISPEQARGLSDLTPATDLYSLGATLFHLLTGQVPFDGPTAAVIMTRHLTDPCPSVCKLSPKVSAGAEKIVHRCMNKEPDNRYEDALELVADIDKVLGGGSGRYNKQSKESKDSKELKEKGKGKGTAARVERERERARASEPEAEEDVEEEEDDRKSGPKSEQRIIKDRETTNRVGSVGSVAGTRSFRRRRSSSGWFSALFFMAILAAALYYMKVNGMLDGKPPGATNGTTPPPKQNGGEPPKGPPPRAAVPATLGRAADGSFVYKADFDKQYDNFDCDPQLCKAGQDLKPLTDSNQVNTVMKLAKIRSMPMQEAGSMIRLLLPADTQFTGKATLKFKIYFDRKYDDANPEVQIHWDHLREGGGTRFLSKWSIKNPEFRNNWTDVSVELNAAPTRLASRQTADKPQSICIFAARPDETVDVFIDELELSDGPAAAGATPAPAVAPPPKKESPVVPPPKKEDTSDALKRAL
jgi:eukaryotic-like serine/threonine-protein kinase